MKKVIGYLLIVFCCVIETSCSFNKQQKMSNTNHTIIGINSDKIRNVKVFLEHDDYYNQLDKYLRLNRFVKLAPEPLLAPLKKVHIINDCIYVLDRMNRFVCYDLEGKVLYQIYAVGNGPGEYSGINTFAMDMKRNELVLYDNLKTSLFIYTLDRGIYKRTEQLLKPNPTEMVFHQETFFYNNRHHNNYPNDSLLHYSLLVANNSLKVDKVCFPHNDAEENYIFSPSLQTFNINGDTLYYCKNFDSKVYHVTKDSIFTCYDIALPNPLPMSKIKIREDEMKLIQSDYSYGISHIYESNGLLYFRFFNGGYFRNVLYDLHENRQICCVKALQENFATNLPIIDIVDGVYEGKFYSVLMPDFIDYKMNRELFNCSPIFQDYDEELENPVIAFYEVIHHKYLPQ